MTDDKLRAALEAAANMGSCSQTHHWFIARRCSEALAALAASAPDEGRVTNMQDTNPRDAGLRVDNPHPLAPDEGHAFHDEWSFQRSMSAGNAVAGKPIAANQPCFDCGVTYSKHARPAAPALDEAAREVLRQFGPERLDKLSNSTCGTDLVAALSQGADR